MKKTLKIKKEVESEVELPLYFYEEFSDEEILHEIYTKIDSDDKNYYQTCICLQNDKIVEFNFQVQEDSHSFTFFENELKITKEEFNKQLEKLNNFVRILNKDKNNE